MKKKMSGREIRPYVLASADFQEYSVLASRYLQQRQMVESLRDRNRLEQNVLERNLYRSVVLLRQQKHRLANIEDAEANVDKIEAEIIQLETRRDEALKRAQLDLDSIVEAMVKSEYQRKRYPNSGHELLATLQ